MPNPSKRSEFGSVALVGSGPGDPDLLTVKAHRLIAEADVVIHDRLTPAPIVALARAAAKRIEVGKVAGGPSWKQFEINDLLVAEASLGARVVRLKSGDPGIFGRLDEEMDALDAAGIPYDIVPGITSAASAAAEIKVSLTKRGRNTSVRFMTGHDVEGFAEHDWRALAKSDAAAAIYMGVRAARFLQGRLLIHGAQGDTPVTAVENASRPEQRVVASTLADFPDVLAEQGVTGPAILFLGLAPRDAKIALRDRREAI